ncbi:MAG: AmmeMemoRadiSam system protein B [Anaerolineales bacterium]|nr:AmmeMemoRadiSam system protein B [Anaerolineales bacterium]
MTSIAPVRPSPIAGTWYEGNASALARRVDEYLDQAELPELPGEVVAVIAPHAGYTYSGPVAGYAFAAVRGRRVDLAVVVSPMHQPYAEPLLTSAHASYATPLGEVPLDKEALAALDAALQADLGQGLTPVAYDREHSLEIELPFLQRALEGDFKLLPLMLRAQSAQISQGVGAALAEVLRGRNFLLVASTDLSHFYCQAEAVAYDQEMLRRVEAFDPTAVFAAEVEGKGYACGLGALTAVLWAAQGLGADTVRVLRHATSGDVTGDNASVVGYGAAVVLKSR